MNKPTVNPNDEALRVERQIVRMVVDHPFFATLVLKMSMVQDDRVPTFCTNGEDIRYNPQFSATLTDQEILTVLAHEVLHPALGHLWRIDGRDMKKWNMATDYEINNFLMAYNADEKKAGRIEPFKLPEGALIDPKYSNMVGEEIYPLLPDPPEGDPGGEGEGEGEGDGGDGPAKPGKGGMGDFTDPKAGPGNSEQEWQRRMVEGQNSAKLQGRGAGECSRLVEKHLRGQQDWKEILRDLLSTVAANDYDEQRPDRRFLEEDIYLPSLYSEQVGPFVVALDTSGSVDQAMLSGFLGEVQHCMDTVHPEYVTVMDCDDKAYQQVDFQDGDNVTTFEPKGGGGTSFVPVFEAVDKMDRKPEAVVYFTDGYGTFPDKAPPCPVIWVDYGGSNYPFGEVVRVNSAR